MENHAELFPRVMKRFSDEEAQNERSKAGRMAGSASPMPSARLPTIHQRRERSSGDLDLETCSDSEIDSRPRGALASAATEPAERPVSERSLLVLGQVGALEGAVSVPLISFAPPSNQTPQLHTNIAKGNIAALFFPTYGQRMLPGMSKSASASRERLDVDDYPRRTHITPPGRGRGRNPLFNTPRSVRNPCSTRSSAATSPTASPVPEDSATLHQLHNVAIEMLSMHAGLRGPPRRPSYTSQSIFSLEEQQGGDAKHVTGARRGYTGLPGTASVPSMDMSSQEDLATYMPRQNHRSASSDALRLSAQTFARGNIAGDFAVPRNGVHSNRRYGTRSVRSEPRFQDMSMSSDIDSSNLETAESMDDRDTAGETEQNSPALSPRPKQRRGPVNNQRKVISVVWEKRYKRIYVSPAPSRTPASQEERKRCRTCQQLPSSSRPVAECRVCHAFFHPDCEEPPFTWAYEASHVLCSQECLARLQDRVVWLGPPNLLLASGHLRNLALCIPPSDMPRTAPSPDPVNQSDRGQDVPLTFDAPLAPGDCVHLVPPSAASEAPISAVVRSVFFDTLGLQWFFYSVIVDDASAPAALSTVWVHETNPVPASCVTRVLAFKASIGADDERRHRESRLEALYGTGDALALPEGPVRPISAVLAQPAL